MNITKKEKSASWKNNNNLKPARDHYQVRRDKIHENFEFEVWTINGLNWPEWEFVRKLICHTYGTSMASGIKDDMLESANALGISMIDSLFDANEKHLINVKNQMEEGQINEY
jgi:hypothetical protein